MREPREWDEEYLLNLPVGEFDWLEVKGRRGLDLTLGNVKEPDVRHLFRHLPIAAVGSLSLA